MSLKLPGFYSVWGMKQMPRTEAPFGNKSYPYAVGRVKARESSRLDRTQWGRLLEADSVQAMQILREYGYGGDSTETDIDLLTGEELHRTVVFINEITPDRTLTDLFLYPADGQNLKLFLKARLFSEENVDAYISRDGSLNPEILKVCVAQEDFSLLPAAWQQVLTGIFEITNPRLLSAAVDRAVFSLTEHVLKEKNNDLLRTYYETQVRYLNILAKMRAERLHWGEKETREMLLPMEGELPSLPEEDISDIERKMNRELLEIVRSRRDDSFGIAPIVLFLLEKRTEARNLRILFAAKRAGLPVAADDLELI